MEGWVVVVLPLAVFLALLALRLPIAFSLGVSGLLGYSMLKGFTIALDRLGIALYQTVSTFVLSPVPLFVLMGEFIVISGVGAGLYEACWKWMGRLPGGLGVASTFACAIFATMSGASVTGTATLGMVAIPEMKKRGYDMGLATGCLAAGGTLGILIPPSITFVLYGLAAEQSVGKLFIAGIIPGIILTFLYAGYVFVVAVRNPGLAPAGGPVPLREKFRSLRQLWAVIVLIVSVLGSIYAGIATVSEAAAIGALAAMLIALAYGKLDFTKLRNATVGTAVLVGYMFIIVTFAIYFGVYMTLSGASDALLRSLVSLPVNPWLIMVGINLFYIVLGCFLDPMSIILLTIPLLRPVVAGLGFDPIWFGVIVVINMELAFITPPLGLNLFVIRGIAPEVPFETVLRGALPFMLLDILCIVIVSLVPQTATWLPGLMMK